MKPMKLFNWQKDHFSEKSFKHRRKSGYFKSPQIESINCSSIEIQIKIYLGKALKLNSLDNFLKKYFFSELKNFMMM